MNKTKQPILNISFVILLLIWFNVKIHAQTKGDGIKPSNLTKTESIKEWRDTMLYPALRFESKGVEINYTLDQKYDLDEEYEIKIQHNIPDDRELETIEISEKDLFIKMKTPWRGEIKLDFITEKKKAAQLNLFLFPCTEADYQRYQSMPASLRQYVISNDSTLHIPLKKGETLTNKHLVKTQQTPPTFRYTPPPNFIGLDKIVYYRKEVFSPCGGSMETSGWFDIYVTPNRQQNTAPIAVNDTIILTSINKKPNLIFPLNNDLDEKAFVSHHRAKTFKIDSIFSVAHGLAKKRSANTISYYSPKKVIKSDTIIYSIQDNHGLKSTAKVFISLSNDTSDYKLNIIELLTLIGKSGISELKKYHEIIGIDFSKGNILIGYSSHSYDEHYTPSEMVDFLLESGTDINYQQTNNGRSALHNAVENGHFELVKALIENGANIEIKDKRGNTPLWNTVKQCRGNEKRIEMIKLLVSKGSSFDTKNNHEISARDMINEIGLEIDNGHNKKEWDLRYLLK